MHVVTEMSGNYTDKMPGESMTVVRDSRVRNYLTQNAFPGWGISHLTVVYLVAKPLIWSEAEDDLVVIETNI